MRFFFTHSHPHLPTQVDRIARFFGVALTAAKREAVIAAAGFGAMAASAAGKPAAARMRKGAVGDWRNHLSAERWAAVDQAFKDRLDDVHIAEPLWHYHQYEARRDTSPRYIADIHRRGAAVV